MPAVILHTLALAGSAVVNIDARGWIWLALVLCQSHTVKKMAQWETFFSPSSFMHLSLSLFPQTPVMRQTRKWGIVTPGNSFKTHREKKKQKRHPSLWFLSHGAVWWTGRQGKKDGFVPCNNNIDCVMPYLLLYGKLSARHLQGSQTVGSAREQHQLVECFFGK